ncbi:MAG: hypothetical protein CO094_04655 [Anaerolineae bacterium CG_4_9_14_3_um_filter_57_17]|nr:hypothetical protein [bacterium]NCT19869.1 hypothetical protein [bacterium]OIO83526.1 MAG: hypothetical protein AUK01_12375 [Anaerolineae bacterium CG2_30_57_67]PJB67254.1 MAG: hypothetical protein CO094_04655 [Anaerolineae bacterium CG_4_9_14_3_um_filter_57_17]
MKRTIPDPNRLSVLLASVLLAYVLARLIDTGRPSLDWNILGVVFSIPFNLSAVTSLLAAGLAATGMDWLLRAHPNYERASSPEHWLLPALTAFAIGIPLYTLNGAGWWLTLGLGAVLLLLVFISEYIVLDVSDPRSPAASAGLAALSFAFFLVLTAALEYSNARLAFILLTVFPAAALVSLRAMHLRLERWQAQWALGIGLVCAQLAAALHYWPIAPAQYGLAILGPLYALTQWGIQQEEQTPLWRTSIENGLVLLVFWGAALFLRP